jgi:hypothetical protein
MSNETRLNYLNAGGYRSGRVIAESGEVVNFATALLNATDISNAIITINLEHSKIHQGEGWEVSIETGNIASAASYYVLFKTSEGYRPHLRSYEVTATDSPITIRLFEGATVSADGSEVTARNRNRNESDVNGISVFSQPTVTNEGTRLETDFIPTSGNKAGGNVGSFYEEFVLKPSTNYLIKITNGSNNTVDAFFNAFWYT